jgi:hypothetical protein
MATGRSGARAQCGAIEALEERIEVAHLTIRNLVRLVVVEGIVLRIMGMQ